MTENENSNILNERHYMEAIDAAAWLQSNKDIVLCDKKQREHRIVNDSEIRVYSSILDCYYRQSLDNWIKKNTDEKIIFWVK